METLRPAGRPVRGPHQVAAALAALVRSARHELLAFDDPGSSMGKGLPLPFLEFATACVRAAAERASPQARHETHAETHADVSSGAGSEGPDGQDRPDRPTLSDGYDGYDESDRPDDSERSVVSDAGVSPLPALPLTVRRIVPRRSLAVLPYELRVLACGARQTESIPFKMVLVDRTTAALPLDFDLHFNGVLLIRDPLVVGALVRVHQHWWDSGEDVRLTADPPEGSLHDPATDPAPVDAETAGAAGPEAGVLPFQLRPVLDAMLCGLTDEAAAARLGMSPRTYSRRVGELLTALGTTSRFRAGAEAARRGWV